MSATGATATDADYEHSGSTMTVCAARTKIFQVVQ
jgi:hypothetical protein